MGLFKKSCYTNMQAQAPNPKNCTVIETLLFPNATLLRVKYNGCSNFEGEKILVYDGYFTPSGTLDPHFSDFYVCPIARFKPDERGLQMAINFCKSLG